MLRSIYEDLCNLYSLMSKSMIEEGKINYFENKKKILKKQLLEDITIYQDEINRTQEEIEEIILGIKSNVDEVNNKYNYLLPLSETVNCNEVLTPYCNEVLTPQFISF